MNGSHDLWSLGVYQCPYDEDSDLEFDLDGDLPCDVPEMSGITAREPRPDLLSRPLSPVNITDLDTVQSIPHESPTGRISPMTSIFETLGSDSMSGSISMFEYDKAESPVCDVQADEPTGRCAEEYWADEVESQETISASLPRLALVNDATFVLLYPRFFPMVERNREGVYQGLRDRSTTIG
ncbi:uncharacterized protein ARMOST_21134 [Armillaria ostoyae]|uniref:Uncharacterized protein n=1 Tax=Armillaria ostoyae TaxID=47428 RepID=A0A284S990_ARMOS|nr:uncharacterized protein ARMOST_21134 [Armillaria ostoyae]